MVNPSNAHDASSRSCFQSTRSCVCSNTLLTVIAVAGTTIAIISTLVLLGSFFPQIAGAFIFISKFMLTSIGGEIGLGIGAILTMASIAFLLIKCCKNRKTQDVTRSATTLDLSNNTTILQRSSFPNPSSPQDNLNQVAPPSTMPPDLLSELRGDTSRESLRSHRRSHSTPVKPTDGFASLRTSVEQRRLFIQYTPKKQDCTSSSSWSSTSQIHTPLPVRRELFPSKSSSSS